MKTTSQLSIHIHLCKDELEFLLSLMSTLTLVKTSAVSKKTNEYYKAKYTNDILSFADDDPIIGAYAAVSYNDTELLSHFLAKSYTFTAYDYRKLIHRAIDHDFANILQFMYTHYDRSQLLETSNILIISSRLGKLNCLKFALHMRGSISNSVNANYNTYTAYNMNALGTTLNNAIYHGQLEIVKYLISIKTPVLSMHFTNAVKMDRMEIAQLLLPLCADVRPDFNMTIAIKCKNKRMIAFLYQNCDIDITQSVQVSREAGLDTIAEYLIWLNNVKLNGELNVGE